MAKIWLYILGGVSVGFVLGATIILNLLIGLILSALAGTVIGYVITKEDEKNG